MPPFLLCVFKEFLFCGDGGASQTSEEALQFLNKLLSAQHFLQVRTEHTLPPLANVAHYFCCSLTRSHMLT